MMPFPQLNLPAFDAKVQKAGNGYEIWDIQRKRYIALTPEEWVRQHMVHYLVHTLQYPAGLVAVEKEIAVLRTRKRFDMVVYDKTAKPWMIVECKAYDQPLNQGTMEQAGRYNIPLKAPYLVLTNGMQYIVAQIDRENGSYTFLKEFPEFQP